MAAQWAEVLGCRAERSGETWRIGLRVSELSFTNLQDERSDGLRAVNVVASDARATRDTVERRFLINGEGYVILRGTGSPREPLTAVILAGSAGQGAPDRHCPRDNACMSRRRAFPPIQLVHRFFETHHMGRIHFC